MFTYKTLEHINTETLHQAFLNAFSDYQVKIDLPFRKFQQMLQRRGYVPELSMGAFEDEALVGFTLNGLRDWNHNPTVYDTGTGVIPAYRKQGITTNIFHSILELLKEKNVAQYLLEVIQTNTAAFELYKKQGFEVTRTFSCFHLEKSRIKPRVACKIEHLEGLDTNSWEHIASFWDFQPSWQNSIDSIKAVPDAFIYSVARIDDTIVGYGIIDKKTGDIPQLAVECHYRGNGIAGTIVTDLVNNAESNRIAVINVDGEAETMKDFLRELGFEHYIDQYEMILQL